jgi:prepilin-type processing-associated H-X9-DG protein
MLVPSSSGGPPNQSAFASAPTYGAAYMCQVFGVMSNELGTPKILVCPADERNGHTNFLTAPNNGYGNAGLDNSKISYFLGKDASDSKPQMILAGDRNIYGVPTYPATMPTFIPAYGNDGIGTSIMATAISMGTNMNSTALPIWTPGKMHQGQGNALLADGSVQQLNSAYLRQALSNSGDTSAGVSSPGPNTLLFP